MPGLSAEEPKPSQAGSGLACGYTISRAILSDAVALVRGDRYVSYLFLFRRSDLVRLNLLT